MPTDPPAAEPISPRWVAFQDQALATLTRSTSVEQTTDELALLFAQVEADRGSEAAFNFAASLAATVAEQYLRYLAKAGHQPEP